MAKKFFKTALCIGLACWLVVAPVLTYGTYSQLYDVEIMATRDICGDRPIKD